MDIPHELRPADSLARKRSTDGQRTPPAGTPAPRGGAAPAATDKASFGDAAAVHRYVAVLKTANPVHLHKVEELRARIADGSYTAEPEELADMILGKPSSGSPARPNGRA